MFLITLLTIYKNEIISTMNYQTTITEKWKDLNADHRKAVGEFLRTYNQAAMEGFNKSHCVEIVAKNDEGEVIGGLYGFAKWGWLYVDWLAIHEDYRHKGIGRELMRQAEEKALELKVPKIRLNTFEFQAPDFYKKLGYEVAAIEEGFPEGFKTYYLQKYLE